MKAVQARRLALAALAVVGWTALVGVFAPRWSEPAAPASALRNPALHQQQRKSEETRLRFDQAVAMLHAKQFEHAVTALHRVLELAPELPEAHVNMGFALLGLHRADEARDFFASALALRATQANAYYGLAVAEETRGDFASALGAMRSYLHTSTADDPYRARARAALWEWERALGRERASPATAGTPR